MNKKHLVLVVIVIVATFLRLYKLDQNPPSLYWDEASLGYNAFAILTKGIDEHGERYPLARFIAFGDYKPPGYIYSIVPFMALFGVNEFAIRLPSAISGILMVLGTYWFTKKLTGQESIGLVAAGLLAFSPWSLQLSRAAFEAHLAALFSFWGILCFFAALRRPWFFVVAVIFFTLSFYTFNANRILAPLFILLLITIYRKEVWPIKKWLIVGGLVGFLLLLPSIEYLRSRESRLRFHEVSIFTSLNTVKKANERIARAGNTWWANILHNRRMYFLRDFLTHYVDHFKGKFLFVSGDSNPRLSIQDVGELYLFELPFLLLGMYVLLRWKNKTTALLLGWLMIAPIPSATARETPHMLRSASLLPVYQVIVAIGFVYFGKWLLKKRGSVRNTLSVLLIILITLNLGYYFHNYWIHYPQDWAGQWQYGYKQMVGKVRELEGNYERVTVTQNLGRPYIYFLLYNQVDPYEYVKTRQAERDWYGLWNVYGFGKYDFLEKPAKEDEKVLSVKNGKDTVSNKLDDVLDPDGQVVFEIGEL